MKRFTTLLLVLLLSLSFSACSGKQEDKQTVSINIKLPMLTFAPLCDDECKESSHFLSKAFAAFVEQYDKYNVEYTVSNFEQTDYDKAFRDAYGTDDAPDLTFGGYFAMSGYIYDGHVVPLDDIITDEIRADFSQGSWDQSKGSNGKTYLMPFYGLQNILQYNKDMFIECGLQDYVSDEEVIQSWTLNQWETILSTLREKLPDTSYPMMMYAKNNQGDTHTMVILRCMGSNFFDENGLVNLSTKEGIAGLQWIKDNYDKGYYPNNAQDIAVSDCYELFQNGQLGIYIWNTGIASYEYNFNVGYVNFPSSDANGANSNWISGFMAFDNGDDKKIEVVKDFLTYVYTTDEWLNYGSAGLPCSKAVANRYADQIPLGSELSKNDKYAVNFTANNPNWPAVREAFWPHIYALLNGDETAQEAAKGLDEDCNKAINSGTRILHE